MLGKFWLAFVLVNEPTLAGAETWMRTQTENMHRLQGRFVQRDYGLSVAAPHGATADVTNGGDGNNGELMILGNRREISVYPPYVVSDPPPTPCDATQLPWATGRQVRVRAINLAGALACRVVGIRGTVVWDLIETEKSDRRTGIIYALLLTTTREAAPRDERSFRSLADNFWFVAISP
jgi:hypothetical protein